MHLPLLLTEPTNNNDENTINLVQPISLNDNTASLTNIINTPPTVASTATHLKDMPRVLQALSTLEVLRKNLSEEVYISLENEDIQYLSNFYLPIISIPSIHPSIHHSDNPL